MPKQWVDITTIDNNTPFMKVRWKGSGWKGGNGPDCWFAEASGLTTDNKSWSQGTKDFGWYSAHRMNGGNYLGYPIYSCSFNFDHTASGYWDQSGKVYRDHVKDAKVSGSGMYDTTVVIDGTTYYEIDFSLWSGASGYNLYMPYANPLNKWSAGDIYVEIGGDPVSIDKSSITFKATGGSDTVVVTADDTWTAVVSDNWITTSTLSGGSGDTTVTISAPNYTDTTTDRTGTVVFTCSGFSATLTVKQNKVVSGGIANVYLGDLSAEAMYVGDLQVEAMYLGDDLIFPQPTPIVVTGFTKCAYSNFNPQAGEYYTFASLYSDNKWYVPSSSFSNGTSVCSEVTYSNDTITNLPSDLLLFEIETATGGYYLKRAGTSNYLQVSGTNLSLGSTPALFTFSEDIIDANGSIIYVSSDAAVCKPDSGNRMLIINAYVSGDPDPLYAREFMLDYIDSSSFGFVCKLFKAI